MDMQDSLKQSAENVETIEQFKQWTRDEVRRVLPHEAFGCSHGRIYAGGVTPDYVITIDLPHSYIAAIRNLSGGIDTPLMRRWLTYREPQLFDAASPPDWPEISPAWLKGFRDYDLRNAAVHAEYDTERCLCSYFSFLRLPHAPGPHEREILLAISPVIHEVMIKVIRNVERLEQEGKPDWSLLTQRETELLHWLGSGKSNAEIAEAMQLSENTVKHHISSIFDKTKLANRSSLIAAFLKHPPGIIAKGTKVV